MRIAIDAMGGDRAPDINVSGALRAAEVLDGHTFILVGRADVLRRQLASAPPCISVQDAKDVIEMGEKPVDAIRAKPDSSIAVTMKLLAAGEADAAVAAGSTGAAVTAASLYLPRLPGVKRPGIAVPFPTRNGRICTLIDAGANPDPKPEHLVQYAVMASAYAKVAFGYPNPTVALLNVGSEETKGNLLVKQAKPLFEGAPINFIGNVEGREIWGGVCDVVVCDGFTGNAVLKACEGMAYTLVELVKQHTKRRLTWMLGALLCKSLFEAVADVIDWSEYGGAPLLGFKGICMICHGSSDGKAIANAIRVATEFSKARLNEQLMEAFAGQVGGNAA